jgi:hypothetical protein
MNISKTSRLCEQLSDIIQEVSNDFDNTWRLRKRKIDTQFLILFIFKLILSKNKQGYSSVLHDMWNTLAYDSFLELPQDKPFAASSVCEARQKMPSKIFKDINTVLLKHWQAHKPNTLWKNHRVFAVDGLRLNLPHELSNEGDKIQQPSIRYYPTGLLSVLYSLDDGMAYDFSLESHINERTSLLRHMDVMKSDDIVILDRGYFSYLILHQATEKNINLVCRMQPGGVNGDVKAFFESKEIDKIIDYYPSIPTQYTIKKQGCNLNYHKIKLRLFKYTIGNETYVCSTALLDPSYTIEELSILYHSRWEIEELYKISKQFIDMEDFHSLTETGVKQEIYAHLLLINMARIFEDEAKNQLPSNSDSNDSDISGYWQELYMGVKKIKINFKNCLLVVGQSLYRILLASTQSPASWIPKIITSIAQVRQKIRPGRYYPCVS